MSLPVDKSISVGGLASIVTVYFMVYHWRVLSVRQFFSRQMAPIVTWEQTTSH